MPSIRKQTARFIASLSLLVITSCSGTASQCKQFANVINQAQSVKIEFETAIESAMTKASGAQGLDDLQVSAQDYIDAMDTVTAEIDTMGQSLADINIDDEQLDEYRDSYVATIDQLKAAFDKAQGAMQMVVEAENEEAFKKVFDQFQTQANSAFTEIQTLDVQEGNLIEQVNTYCAPPAE